MLQLTFEGFKHLRMLVQAKSKMVYDCLVLTYRIKGINVLFRLADQVDWMEQMSPES
jgi:hypothetical protein